jgi:hypothetical protein
MEGQQQVANSTADLNNIHKILPVNRIIAGIFEMVPKRIKFAGEKEKDDKKGCHSPVRGEAGSV